MLGERNTRTPATSVPSRFPKADAANPAAAPGALQKISIPEHELLGHIASGAYGDVWLARNAVGTLRAVKIVRSDQQASSICFEREFRGLQKFEPHSRMHESFVDILAVGLLPNDAGFYYVMELADPVENHSSQQEPAQSSCPQLDESLVTSSAAINTYIPRTLRAELKVRGSLSAEEVTCLGLRLAAGLAYLHGQGLVHRDVKPANILYIAGAPKLADAGLVASSDDAQSLVGTAGYIAPEGPGTPQADIYALGKVVYEAAFGKDREEFPALPPDVSSHPDHARKLELNAIVLKACATDKRDRYLTAKELEHDFARLNAGESIGQRHSGVRLRRKAKRAVGALTGVLALGAAVFGVWSRLQSDYEGRQSSIPAAESAFILGRHHYEKSTKADLRLAFHSFDEATRLDPNFAKAYGWLAASQCWSYAGTNREFEFLPAARETALHALALDSRVAKAHQALAWYSAVQTWHWETAEKHFADAHKYAPRDVEVYAWQGYFEACIGRTNEGLANLQKGLRLQPGSIPVRHFLGSALILARRYEEAIDNLRMVIQMEPSGTIQTFSELSEALIKSGKYEEGIEASRLGAIRDGVPDEEAARRAQEMLQAYNAGGVQGYWSYLAKRLGPKDSPVWAANLYARLGQTNEALDLLEDAERAHLWDIVNITTEPGFDSLRSHSRFVSLLHRLRLERG